MNYRTGRWQIELFLRWIEQLRIRRFHGRSEMPFGRITAAVITYCS